MLGSISHPVGSIMWHTPDGVRVLRKAEWAVIREGIASLRAFLQDTPRASGIKYETGIGPFDELPDPSCSPTSRKPCAVAPCGRLD